MRQRLNNLTSHIQVSANSEKLKYNSFNIKWYKYRACQGIDGSFCSVLCVLKHYDDVIMDSIASQITSLTIVYSNVYSGADQSKHQSSASLAFVWGIHRGPVNSPHKWPVTRKMFPFDDVIMSDTDITARWATCVPGWYGIYHSPGRYQLHCLDIWANYMPLSTTKAN